MPRLGLRNLTVVLVRPQGAVNVGLSARACANFGVERLRLVAPGCDVSSMTCRQFANDAQSLLEKAPHARTLADAVADTTLVLGTSARRRRKGMPEPIWGEQLHRVLSEHSHEHVALVFGSESTGLDTQEVLQCHHLLHLSAPGPYPSFNLSHAVALALQALDETASVGPLRGRFEPPAGWQALDQLRATWLQQLEDAGAGADLLREARVKLHRIIGKMALTSDEVGWLKTLLARGFWRHDGPRRIEDQ